jgi:hypothetical protein
MLLVGRGHSTVLHLFDVGQPCSGDFFASSSAKVDIAVGLPPEYNVITIEILSFIADILLGVLY